MGPLTLDPVPPAASPHHLLYVSSQHHYTVYHTIPYHIGRQAGSMSIIHIPPFSPSNPGPVRDYCYIPHSRPHQSNRCYISLARRSISNQPKAFLPSAPNPLFPFPFHPFPILYDLLHYDLPSFYLTFSTPNFCPPTQAR